jgi:ABC-type uncharacterized transport system permease subunit
MGAVGLTGIGSGEELVQILRKTWSAGIGRGNGHLALLAAHGKLNHLLVPLGQSTLFAPMESLATFARDIAIAKAVWNCPIRR